jgi:hypothetical protein
MSESGGLSAEAVRKAVQRVREQPVVPPALIIDGVVDHLDGTYTPPGEEITSRADRVERGWTW